jgi:hypothetical protein
MSLETDVMAAAFTDTIVIGAAVNARKASDATTAVAFFRNLRLVILIINKKLSTRLHLSKVLSRFWKFTAA